MNKELANNLEAFEIIKTDKLKVRYAPLPVIDLSMRYLVQVVAPIELVPTEKAVTGKGVFKSISSLENLEKLLLDEYQEMVKDLPEDHELRSINEVELIPCYLLKPVEER